jgi:glycine/D-amino acid oxidase-like deaminating enzyme
MRVIVIGAGVMGAWTARWLRRAGHAVTLVDRHGPANTLGSSGDESRITRSAHGPDRHYPVWQRRALEQWRELEREAGEQLFVPCGVAWLANERQTFEADSADSLTALGISFERWTTAQLAARMPMLDPTGIPWALFEPEAGALMARRGVAATIAAFEREGGDVVVGRALPPTVAGGDALGRVLLEDGRALEADAFVFAAGPWLPDLFPEVLGPIITTHRQDVMKFGMPAGQAAAYAADRMPAWIDFDGSFYGFPSFDGASVKACPDWLGPIERPDDSARVAAEATIEGSRRILRQRFPSLAEQPLVTTWTCFYEVTPDAHFVIDRHPTIANLWLAGGGTGHAFKHGPVIGEYLAALVSGDRAGVARLAPPDDRFAIHARNASPSFRTSGRNPLDPDSDAVPYVRGASRLS